MSANALKSIQYSLRLFKMKHVNWCIRSGQPTATDLHLCQYIPPREWVCIESELEKRDFLLRDRIGDLIGSEEWDND